MYVSEALTALCHNRLTSNCPFGAKLISRFFGRVVPLTLPPMLASMEKLILGTVIPPWTCLVPASTPGTDRPPRPGLDGARETMLVDPALTVTGDRLRCSFHIARNRSYIPWVACPRTSAWTS